jgi:hypothetical protein
MAKLADGDVLSKEFGHYQTSEASVTGPDFIPPNSKARISLHLAYSLPTDGAEANKSENDRIISSLSHRLKELNGFVIFDQDRHYRIDLPCGWRDWPDVKNAK